MRDRRINDLAKKEIILRDKMQDRLHNYEEISVEIMSIVSLFKFITAAKMVMRYCKTLKSYSIKICKAQHRKDFNSIEDIQPYIEGIIWSVDKLNL